MSTPNSQNVLLPLEVVEFLKGTGELEGCAFGEKPKRSDGSFWWRKYLFAAIAEHEQSGPSGQAVHPDNIEVMISSLLSVVQYDMRESAEKDLRALVAMCKPQPEAGKDDGQ